MGEPADVAVKATGEHFTGQVTRSTDSLDRTTRTMQVEIDVPNETYKLQPGMYADVRCKSRTIPNALTIPMQAVQHETARASVLIVDQQNQVQAREIQTGSRRSQPRRSLVGTERRRSGDCRQLGLVPGRTSRRTQSQPQFDTDVRAGRSELDVRLRDSLPVLHHHDVPDHHRGRRDHHGRACRSTCFPTSTFRSWWWRRSTPACRRSRLKPTSPIPSSGSSRWAAASIISSRGR